MRLKRTMFCVAEFTTALCGLLVCRWVLVTTIAARGASSALVHTFVIDHWWLWVAHIGAAAAVYVIGTFFSSKRIDVEQMLNEERV